MTEVNRGLQKEKQRAGVPVRATSSARARLAQEAERHRIAQELHDEVRNSACVTAWNSPGTPSASA